MHGPTGPSTFVPDRGYMRACICGREFFSWSWNHVPAFYDHLSIVPKATRVERGEVA